MPRWFAFDLDDHVGVFDSDDLVPDAARDLQETDLDLTLKISRRLRVENHPVPSRHARVRSGSVLMIGSTDVLKAFADHVEWVARDVLFATFPHPARGRPATFMPHVRTFGTELSNEQAALELVHAAGACQGCVVDRAYHDRDQSCLEELGLYAYGCDEDTGTVWRHLTPSVPLTATRLGSLSIKCLRYLGRFAEGDGEEFSVGTFARPQIG